MSPNSVSADQFWIRAIILSLVLHTLVVRFFIFIWPVKKEPHLPKLVFFGAVLERSELTGLAMDKTNQGMILQPKRINYHPSHTQTPYEDRGVAKPAYREVTAGTPKTVLKFNYISTPITSMPQNPEPAESSTFPEALEYQPLRLNPK